MSGVISRIGFALVLVGIGLTLSGCSFNVIPTLEEVAKARWAEVQNQYQRRADLIPNLVATVQGYAKQEREVLTSVIEARAKATQIKVDASRVPMAGDNLGAIHLRTAFGASRSSCVRGTTAATPQ